MPAAPARLRQAGGCCARCGAGRARCTASRSPPKISRSECFGARRGRRGRVKLRVPQLYGGDEHSSRCSGMADVFVSYARGDKARVAPLVAAIEAQGWSVWWDPSINPGEEFDRQIAAELKAAAAVLVVWTPNSVGSRWVRGEAREGADRGILVPVRFED